MVRAAMKGDAAAFERIVRQYQEPVLAAIYRLLGPRSVEDAEDAAQEVFAKLARAISTFDFARRTRFSTWLFTFVRNHCFDVMRRRRAPMLPLGRRGDPDEAESLPASDEPPPARSLQSSEARRLLAHAIAQLPEPEREVFVRREIQGLSILEIASEMDTPAPTIRSRLHRAKLELRAKLEPYLRDGSAPFLRPQAAHPEPPPVQSHSA